MTPERLHYLISVIAGTSGGIILMADRARAR